MNGIFVRVITWIIAIITIMSACMLDSISWIPAIVFFAGTAYLIIYAYLLLNGEYEMGEEHDD